MSNIIDDEKDIIDIEDEAKIKKYKESFRERVTELRLDKGMNEVQMSLELRNSRNYIHNIASGAILPSMGQFFKLCSYLELEPEEFFDPALAHPSKAKQILRLLENLNDETQEDVKRIIEKLSKSEQNLRQGGELNG